MFPKDDTVYGLHSMCIVHVTVNLDFLRESILKESISGNRNSTRGFAKAKDYN